MLRKLNIQSCLLPVVLLIIPLQGCKQFKAAHLFGRGTTVNMTEPNSLQAAHDALPNSGGKLIIPCGTFASQHLIITKPNVELSGKGACSVLDGSQEKSTQPIIMVRAGGTYLHDFSINGGRKAGGGASSITIGVPNQTPVDNVKLEHLVLSDSGGASIDVLNTKHLSIRDNHLYRSGYSGIRLAGRNVGGISDVVVENNFIQDPNLSQNLGHSGIHADGDEHTNNVQNLMIAHNTVEVTDHHGTVGYQLNAVQNAHVVDNRVIGDRVSGEGISFTGNYVSVERNEASGAAAAGILFFATKNGNHDVTIIKNTVHDNAGQGIALVWGENDVTITNVEVRENRCFDTGAARQKLAIQTYRGAGVTDGSVSNVRVMSNEVTGDPNTAFNLLPPTSGQYDFGR